TVYDEFFLFAEQLSILAKAEKEKKGTANNLNSTSGKAGSYSRYLLKLTVIYIENTGEVINKLDTFETLKKLETLKNYSNFAKYNEDEGRFPNATLNCFKSFLLDKALEQNDIIDQITNQYSDSHFNSNTLKKIYSTDT